MKIKIIIAVLLLAVVVVYPVLLIAIIILATIYLLSKLLLVKRTRKQNLPNGKPRKATYSVSDPKGIFQGNQDVLDGMEFIATMQLKTPLKYLEMHRKVFTNTNDFPYYDLIYGCLIPKTKTWADLGISGLKEIPEGTMASDIGQIPVNGGIYLKFLKDFRRIVESDMLPEEKRQQILALRSIDKSYAEIMDKHHDLTNGNLDQWCGYDKSLGITGFDSRLSRNLWDAGFRSQIEIRKATNAQLMKVPGIGKVKAAKLKQFIIDSQFRIGKT